MSVAAPSPGRTKRRLTMGAVGLGGLIVGIALGASGHQKAKTVTETSTVTAAAHVRTVRVATPRAVTVVRTLTAPSAPKPVPAPASARNTFSGNGEKNIGTLHVASTSVLAWHDNGGTFAITNSPNDSNTIDVDSTAHSGTTVLQPGDYHDVDILGLGDWGFTLTRQ